MSPFDAVDGWWAICFALFAISLMIGGSLASMHEPLEAPPSRPWTNAAYIDLPLGRTHYFDVGPHDAPVILLFHGSARGVADWQEGLAEALAKDWRVVGFDYYGNGFSARGLGLRYGDDLWAEQGIALMDALHIERAVFAGHSVGGVVAALAAAEHPRRARALVTIGTGVAIDPSQIAPLAPGLGEIVVGGRSRLSDVFSPAHARFMSTAHAIRGTRFAYLVYVRRQYTIDGLRLLGLFDRLQLPALHVSGTADRSVPHAAARALALRTGGRFVAFEGVGHDVHVEAPEELAQTITDFAIGLTPQ